MVQAAVSQDHIVLVGTKLDKAEADDEKCFLHGIDGHDSVHNVFFQDGDAKESSIVQMWPPQWS